MMAECTRVISSIIRDMGKEYFCGQMGDVMKENSLNTIKRGMGYLFSLMELSILELGKRTKSMEKEPWSHQIVTTPLRECGPMERMLNNFFRNKPRSGKN